MAYYRECDANIPAPVATVETDYVFYLDGTTGTGGSGLTIESPFQNFEQYRAYVVGHNLTGTIGLYVMDGEFYEAIDFSMIVGNGEYLTIYAPFATIGIVNFAGTGDTYYDHCRLVANYIVGDVVMSRENSIECVEMGIRSGAPLPQNFSVATTITFDNRDHLDNVTISAKKFDGSIELSHIWRSDHGATINLDFTRWSHNNTQLHNMLATLPAQGLNLSREVEVRGRVNGLKLPLPLPRFKQAYSSPINNGPNSFPVVFNEYSDLNNSLGYILSYFVDGGDNIDTDASRHVEILTDGQGGINPNSSQGFLYKEMENFTFNTLSGLVFTLRLEDDDITELAKAPTGVPIVFQYPITLRQFQDRTNYQADFVLEVSDRQDLTVADQPLGS